MMGYGFDGGAGGWIWMIGGLLLMIGVVVLIVWIINTANQGSSIKSSERPSALDILRERYARGEITQQEFEQAKKTLG
jgi:putative membrane protein